MPEGGPPDDRPPERNGPEGNRPEGVGARRTARLTKEGRTSLDDMARYGSLGIQYAGTIVVLGALGYWADSAFDTLPWFLIAGILLGSVGGFISLVKKVPGPQSSRSKGHGATKASPSDSGNDPPNPR